MKELFKEQSIAVHNELLRANAKHPLFNSPHEGYSVIREEIDEIGEEFNKLKFLETEFWRKIKRNQPIKDEFLQEMGKYAMLVACEAIQSAAMVQKFINSMDELKVIEDSNEDEELSAIKIIEAAVKLQGGM